MAKTVSYKTHTYLTTAALLPAMVLLGLARYFGDQFSLNQDSSYWWYSFFAQCAHSILVAVSLPVLAFFIKPAGEPSKALRFTWKTVFTLLLLGGVLVVIQIIMLVVLLANYAMAS